MLVKKILGKVNSSANKILAMLFFALLSVQNVAAQAVLDLSGAETAVKTEVAGAAPVIAFVLGVIIAIGIVIALIKRSSKG